MAHASNGSLFRHRNRIQLFLAGALVVHAFITATPWSELRLALFGPGSYESRQAEYGFRGLPVGRIRNSLNQLLACDTPVALSGALTADPFVQQRLTEGLYPRRIDQASAQILDRTESLRFDPRSGLEAARDGRSVFLLRGPRELPATCAAAGESLEISILRFFCLALSAVGLGMLVTRSFRMPALPFPLSLCRNVLAGALAIGCAATAATWLQWPLLGRALGMIGVAAFAAGALAHCGREIGLSRDASRRVSAEHAGRPWSRFLRYSALALRTEPGRGVRSWTSAARRPENWAFLSLLGLFGLQVVQFPITLWDGRSIWLFRAKELFFHGVFTRSDIFNPASAWSHSDYPLLYPAWLAQFSAFGGSYNERMAGLGIPILTGSLLTLIWFLARDQLGRWAGAAVTASGFLGVARMTAGGNADGFLMLLLLLQCLALFSPRCQEVGWLAGAAASLIKPEGVFLAGIVAIVRLVFAGRGRERRARDVVPLILLTPGGLHLLWGRVIGLTSVFPGIHFPDGAGDLLLRAATIFQGTAKILQGQVYSYNNALLWEGLIAVLLLPPLCLAVLKPDAETKFLMLVAGLFFLFPLAALLVTPYDLQWHVSTAVDRLLLHPSVLCVLILFRLLR